MQYNFFTTNATEKYKITKPIRLIELFGGIGSQAKALTNLGVDFEHYRLVEFDKYAIQSYNAIHNTNFTTQDITKTTAVDLGIVETDKYEYIVTYSFPCTDLSLAGDRKGMAKGDGTRSGLLWEVERILSECEELPQILLMENVPQVLNNDFGGWLEFLEGLGYNNYYEKLNAKDYGIPQNRDRCFMVSILGDFYCEFPKPIKLELRLRDMLESNVDENYYLSNKMLDYCMDMTDRNGFIRGKRFNPHNIEDEYAFAITTNAGNRPTDNFIKIKEATKKGYKEGYVFDGVNISSRMKNQRGNVQKQSIQTITTSGGNDRGVITQDYRIRKLTPKECWRLMGFSDTDFDKAKASGVSNCQLYKQAGNSIVVNVLMAIFGELR